MSEARGEHSGFYPTRGGEVEKIVFLSFFLFDNNNEYLDLIFSCYLLSFEKNISIFL